MICDWSAIGGIGTLVGAIVTAAALVFAVYKYVGESRRSSADRRRDYLDKMLEKFLSNKVREAVLEFDAPDGTDEFFKALSATDEKVRREARRAIDELLFWIEHLLYLKKNSTIKEEEFAFFEHDIRGILSDVNVQRYLENGVGEMDSDSACARFNSISAYIEEHQLRAASCNNNGTLTDGTRCAGASPCCGVAPVGNEIRSEDFDSPTMIIKINKLYTEGMDDDQVYETVRGSWRVRPENADKYKVVLAVAFGIVKGAYLADHWEPSTKPGGQGRYAFVRRRDAAEEKRLARFVGKDVSGLFPKGASNPIRYFDVASEGRKDER